MTADSFVTAYKAALSTQEWQNVEPLIHTNCCVTFSNGTVHKGIEAVKAAYERNFSLIKNEKYIISNIHWLLQSECTSVYIFDYSWSGEINGQLVQGSGRGTAVLVCESNNWYLMAEQLTRSA